MFKFFKEAISRVRKNKESEKLYIKHHVEESIGAIEYVSELSDLFLTEYNNLVLEEIKNDLLKSYSEKHNGNS